MPSSLIIAALVVAWLVVLVPMIARKRQEVAKTTDSALASRVVRSGSANAKVQEVLDVTDEPATTSSDVYSEDRQDVSYTESRAYRPGRGGFDAEAAAEIARAKYAFRQRVVIVMLVLALATGLVAGFAVPLLWWVHAIIDATLIGYLIYLRTQVRIENEIRERRLTRNRYAPEFEDPELEHADVESQTRQAPQPLPEREPEPARPARSMFPSRKPVPGAAVLDIDDSDADFAHLEGVQTAPTYDKAVGE